MIWPRSFCAASELAVSDSPNCLLQVSAQSFVGRREDHVKVPSGSFREPFCLRNAHAAHPNRPGEKQAFQIATTEQDQGLGGVIRIFARHLEFAEIHFADEFYDRQVQLLFALKVRVQGALRSLGARGDHIHGGALKSHFQEHGLGGVKNMLSQIIASS